ncbi:MAG: DUF748 domain-containing protein [Planctomycetota bacterium]|jgi:hypothetical protein
MEEPEAKPEAPPVKKRKRWKKVLLWVCGIFVALVVLAYFIGPPIISSVAHGAIVATVPEKLNATAELDSLSFSWSGNVHLRGLVIRDGEGREVLSVPEIAVDAAPFDAIGGKYIATIRIEGPVIRAHLQEDGSVNLAGLPKTSTEKSEPGPLPHVEVEVTIAGGRFLLIDVDGTVLAERAIEASATLPTFDRPLLFEVTSAGDGTIAANGAITIAKDGRIDAQKMEGTVEFSVDALVLKSLEKLVAAFVPVGGLGGTLAAGGTFELKPGLVLSAKGDASVRDVRLAGDVPVAVPEIRVTGGLDDLLDAEKRGGRVSFDIDAGWEEAKPLLEQFLPDVALEGPDPGVSGTLAIRGSRYTMRGTADFEKLTVTLAGGKSLVQESGTAAFQGRVTPTEDGMEIVGAGLKYGSRTGEITFLARTPLVLADGLSGEVDVEANATLENIIRDAGAVLGLAEIEAEGEVAADWAVVLGEKGRLGTRGRVTIENFESGSVSDPNVEIGADVGLATENLDFTLNNVEVKSSFVRGTMTGQVLDVRKEPEIRALKGVFTFIPEKVGAILEPLLPGTLSGGEEEELTFSLDGKAKDLDLFAILRGSTGGAKLGIGEFAMEGLGATGDLEVEVKGEHAIATGELAVNNGRADVTIDADLKESPDAKSRVKVDFAGIDANAGMTRLLRVIHPIFAIAEGKVDGMISGKIDCKLDLSYRGPVTMDTIRGGWEKLPKKDVDGKGHLEIGTMGLQGTPLLTLLLAVMQEDPGRTFDLNPVDFTIRGGKVTYDRPMRMKISGHKTLWRGSVGLDGKLYLEWEVPVTERLKKKYSFLKGRETLTIPVGGTWSAPELGFDALIAGLAKEAAEKKLRQEAEKKLDRIVGPAELLQKADALWAAGKTEEAKAIYREIHEKHRNSLIYRLNKRRIKDRKD